MMLKLFHQKDIHFMKEIRKKILSFKYKAETKIYSYHIFIITINDKKIVISHYIYFHRNAMIYIL